MIETDRFEQVELDSEQALWNWLEANHQRAEGVWFITYKNQPSTGTCRRISCWMWIGLRLGRWHPA